jgi:tetratricopeptide (TPR) repeat protein
MKNILTVIFLIPVLINTSSSQNLQIAYFDSLINKSLFLSEKALFAANFEEAEKYISISHFEEFNLFRDKHKLKLKIQFLRIQSFKNTLYMQPTNSENYLHTILELQSIVKNIEDNDLLGDYYTLLSSGYHSTGSRDSASYYYNLALQSYKETNNIKKIARVRGSKISREHLSLKAKGKIDKVIQLIPEYEKEIDFSKKCNNKYVLAYNTRHLAQIYLQHTSNYQEAIKLFKMSLDLREEIGFVVFLPASYYSIGEVALKIGNKNMAIEMYNQSIAIADRIGFVRYRFQPRIKMGDIFKKEGNYKEAKKYFIESLKIASENNYDEGIITAVDKENNYDEGIITAVDKLENLKN